MLFCHLSKSILKLCGVRLMCFHVLFTDETLQCQEERTTKSRWNRWMEGSLCEIVPRMKHLRAQKKKKDDRFPQESLDGRQ